MPTFYFIFVLIVGAATLVFAVARAHEDNKPRRPLVEGTFDAHKRQRIALNLARRNSDIRAGAKMRELTR